MFSCDIVWKSGKVRTFPKKFAQTQYNNFDKKNEKKKILEKVC